MKTFWISKQINLDGNHTAFVQEPADFDSAEDDYYFCEYYEDHDISPLERLLDELTDFDGPQIQDWLKRWNAELKRGGHDA